MAILKQIEKLKTKYNLKTIIDLRDYAEEKGVIVKLEELKEKYNTELKKYESKPAFFLFMVKENIASIINKTKDKIGGGQI